MSVSNRRVDSRRNNRRLSPDKLKALAAAVFVLLIAVAVVGPQFSCRSSRPVTVRRIYPSYKAPKKPHRTTGRPVLLPSPAERSGGRTAAPPSDSVSIIPPSRPAPPARPPAKIKSTAGALILAGRGVSVKPPEPAAAPPPPLEAERRPVKDFDLLLPPPPKRLPPSEIPFEHRVGVVSILTPPAGNRYVERLVMRPGADEFYLIDIPHPPQLRRVALRDGRQRGRLQLPKLHFQATPVPDDRLLVWGHRISDHAALLLTDRLFRLADFPGWVTAAASSPGGSLVMVKQDGTASFYAPKSRRPEFTFTTPFRSITAAAVYGSYIVLGGHSGEISIHDANHERKTLGLYRKQRGSRGTNPIGLIAPAAEDSGCLMSLAVYDHVRMSLDIWNYRTLERKFATQIGGRPQAGFMPQLCPLGRRLLAVEVGGELWVHSLAGDAPLRIELPEKSERVRACWADSRFILCAVGSRIYVVGVELPDWMPDEAAGVEPEDAPADAAPPAAPVGESKPPAGDTEAAAPDDAEGDEPPPAPMAGNPVLDDPQHPVREESMEALLSIWRLILDYLSEDDPRPADTVVADAAPEHDASPPPAGVADQLLNRASDWFACDDLEEVADSDVVQIVDDRSVHPFSPERKLLQLSPDDAFTTRQACGHIVALGGVGSGKTATFGTTIAEAMLRAGFSGIVGCVKVNEADRWREFGRRCGALDRMEFLSTESDHRLDMLTYLAHHSPSGETENIIHFLTNLLEAEAEQKGHKDSERYFKEAANEMLRSILTSLRLAGQPLTVRLIHDCITSAPKQHGEFYSESWQRESFLYHTIYDAWVNVKGDPHLLQDLETARNYWLQHQDLDRARGSVESTFTSFASMLSYGPINRMLCSGEVNFTPEQYLEEGRILVMDLPLKQDFAVGMLTQRCLKSLFLRAAEQRAVTDETRPVLVYADEGNLLITNDDLEFMQTAREAKCSYISLAQNLPAYIAAFGDGPSARVKADKFLGLSQNLVLFQQSDHKTAEWASDRLGKIWTHKSSTHGGFTPSPSMLGGGHQSIGGGTHEMLAAQVEPVEFSTLEVPTPENDWQAESYVYTGRRFADGRNHLACRWRRPW